MTMPAITLWQPWASLLVTQEAPPPTPCAVRGEHCPFIDGWCLGERPGGPLCMDPKSRRQMIKRWETRSWPCPPKIIGQRVAFHAAQREPEVEMRIGDWKVVRWSSVDGRSRTFTLWNSTTQQEIDLPLGAVVGSGIVTACYPITDNSEHIDRIVPAPDRAALTLYRVTSISPRESIYEDISDQLPYGNYSLEDGPRFAWLIEDAAPTTERCPRCWGVGTRTRMPENPCLVCDATGRCEPVPARGKQRIWNWTPEVAA